MSAAASVAEMILFRGYPPLERSLWVRVVHGNSPTAEELAALPPRWRERAELIRERRRLRAERVVVVGEFTHYAGLPPVNTLLWERVCWVGCVSEIDARDYVKLPKEFRDLVNQRAARESDDRREREAREDRLHAVVDEVIDFQLRNIVERGRVGLPPLPQSIKLTEQRFEEICASVKGDDFSMLPLIRSDDWALLVNYEPHRERFNEVLEGWLNS